MGGHPGDCAVALDTGDTASPVCYRSLEHHNQLLERRGVHRVSTYQSEERFRFGGGRLCAVIHAADVLVGIAGNTGNFTASTPDADSPALLRKGAMEAPGGQLDFLLDSLVLPKRGIAIPLRAGRTGHHILSVADFGKDASRKARSPVVSAPIF